MANNLVLQELYEARVQIMAEYEDDLGAYLRDAQKRQAASNHPVAQIEQRKIRCLVPATTEGSGSERDQK